MFIKRALPPLCMMVNGWVNLLAFFMLSGEESFFVCLP